MHCTEFRRHYSDFRDGMVTDPALEARMLAHARACAACMRYDARVSRGVTLLKSLSDLEPSAGFRRELRRRLSQPAPAVDAPFTPAHAGVMAALMLLTAVALFWWEASDGAPQAAVARQQPLPAVVASPGVPFVSFSMPTASAASAEWRTPGATAPFASPAVLPR